jgi:hypothetical protein
VDNARRHIVDELLTLKCPRCRAVFLDFEGCFALTCHRCKCAFCGWCLADCNADAHAHVANCPHNTAGRGVFGTQEAFQRAQIDRRQRMVHDYLQSLRGDGRDTDSGGGGAQTLRGKVAAACARDFADLGVRVQ